MDISRFPTRRTETLWADTPPAVQSLLQNMHRLLQQVETQRTAPSFAAQKPAQSLNGSQQQTGGWPAAPSILRQALNTGNIDLDDVTFVKNKASHFPARQLSHAQQIISIDVFRCWMTSPRSEKLFLYWNRHLSRRIANLSPLSFISLALAQNLCSIEGCVSATWFCGLHVDQDDCLSAPRHMLASLVDQLLRQREFDVYTAMLSASVNMDQVAARDEDALARLLYSLVSQIPESTVVFFIIDNVILYEREELHGEFAMSTLLALVADVNVRAKVKLLFTSMPGHAEVREEFEGDGLILNVESLPPLLWAPSDERVARELGTYMK